jgi:A/G-specific adenine glycosylase
MSKPARQQKHQPPIGAAAVLAWYDRNARTLPWRVSPADRMRGVRPDPYRVWLSEIMLQQTTVAAVGNYYARFLELWPSVEALAAAALDAVLVEWAGLGYYARARNLHACALAVVERFGGRFPTNAIELRTLPGIGPYTAAAIASITADEQVAVLDGNVERVLARYIALGVPVRDAKEELRARLQAAVPPRAGDFAQAMMDLGATICAPRSTMCMLCPLHDGCVGARENPLAYPVKTAKAVRPVRYGHAYVMRDREGDVYLRQRPAKGLLAKMTEVPTSEWGAVGAAPEFPVSTGWEKAGHVTHVFTHFQLELDVWCADGVDGVALDEGWWASPGRLQNEALPSLFRKVLAVADPDLA